MSSADTETAAPSQMRRAWIRIGLCAMLIALGGGSMVYLSRLKTPPAEAEVVERALHVETVTVKPETIRVRISGFGEATPLNVVRLAAEIPGRVVYVHPQLEVGEQIARDEVLLRLDTRDYEAAVEQGKATVQVHGDTISRLEKQLAIDQRRLATLARNLTLAETGHDRARALLERDKVGTLAGVEAAEKLVNAARDANDQLRGLVDTYPLQIQEARSQLRVAEAKLNTAVANLDRCEVRCPFDARIDSVDVETGQYVRPGIDVMALADDSELELRVPVDSQDVRRWLQFREALAPKTRAWFAEPERVPVTVRWTESPDTHAWTGTLHRIIAFNRETRTINLAVRIKGSAAVSETTGTLPLVAGMFCSVEIPGRDLENAIRLPRAAVSFRNTVFVAANGRLKTVPVRVAWSTGNEAFIDTGLQAGDAVIVTRLVNPLEGTKLEAVAAVAREEKE